MKTKTTWDSVPIDSEKLLDDDLLKTIFLFPQSVSSRGTANTGKPAHGTIHINKERPSNRNSGKFR